MVILFTLLLGCVLGHPTSTHALQPRETFPSTALDNSTALELPTTTSQILGPTCCVVFIPEIHFADWWTSSIEVTIATIVTQVVQYENTAITTYSTIYNNGTNITSLVGTHSTGWTYPAVPTSLLTNIPYANYFSTVVRLGTTLELPYLTSQIASPTAYAAVNALNIYWATFLRDAAGNSYCTGYPTTTEIATRYPSNTYVTTRISYNEKLQTSLWPIDNGGYLPGTGWDNGRVHVTLPTTDPFYYPLDATQLPDGYRQYWGVEIPSNVMSLLARDSRVLSLYPDIAECTPGYGNGEPSVNIAVNALTKHDTITTTVQEVYPSKGSVSSSSSYILPHPSESVSLTSSQNIDPMPSPTGTTQQPAPTALPGEIPSTNPIMSTTLLVVGGNGNLILPGGQPLAYGSETTLDGTRVSVLPGGDGIVIGPSTIPLHISSAVQAVTLNIGSLEQVILVAENSKLVLTNGRTLLPGESSIFDHAGVSLGLTEKDTGQVPGATKPILSTSPGHQTGLVGENRPSNTVISNMANPGISSKTRTQYQSIMIVFIAWSIWRWH